MTNLSVLPTDNTVGLETFVLFIRYECITCGTDSLLFTYGLFSYLVSLMLVKTCSTPKLLHDSQGIRTAAYEHAEIDIQSLHVS